ncbi:hypothetical protein HN51_021375 [Arachis hypogaea]
MVSNRIDNSFPKLVNLLYPLSPASISLFPIPKFSKSFITTTATTRLPSPPSTHKTRQPRTLSNGDSRLCSAPSISWKRGCWWSISMPFGGRGTDFSSTKQTCRAQAMEQATSRSRLPPVSQSPPPRAGHGCSLEAPIYLNVREAEARACTLGLERNKSCFNSSGAIDRKKM